MALNTDQPDFRQHYDYATLNNFYSCTSQNLDLAANSNAFGLQPWVPQRGNDMEHQALDYQLNLWQQIEARQLNPQAAQNAWIKFANKQAEQREQIRLAEEARELAEQAAAEAQAALDQQNAADAQAAADSQPADTSSSSNNSYYDKGAGKGHGTTCTSSGGCKSF